MVTRSRIILSVASGKSVGTVAAGCGVTCKTVRKWCQRFAQNPVVSTLSDAPRCGRPIQIPSDIRCQIIKLACSNPLKRDPLRNVWTIGSLKQQLQLETGWNVSSSEIHRILSFKEIRPHRVKMWLHSPDPDFSSKVKRICSLYITPPPKATVLCIDEKTGMQALERKYPLKHAGVGREGRKEFEYVRHGTRSLFAALDIKTGAITGHCSPCRGADDLLLFMDHLAKVYPKGPIYIIWDNLNIHHGDRWKKFNQRHWQRFRFVYTPLHASWANQIEIWFSILQRRVLRHGSFKTGDDLQRKVLQFIQHWNTYEAHPFKWLFKGNFDNAKAC